MINTCEKNLVFSFTSQLSTMDSMFLNDSEQAAGGIHIKGGRNPSRKRFQIQRFITMEAVGQDGTMKNMQNMQKKTKVCSIEKKVCTPNNETSPVGILAVDEGEVELRNYPCVAYGSVSLCGRRRAMEDAVTTLPRLVPTFDFFGVYDGHGGSQVSYVCRDRLHQILVEEVEGLDVDGEGFDWKEVMGSCFLKMDSEVDCRGKEDEDMKSIGSTALVALVGLEKVIVANCGDSRAVLSRGGNVVLMSHDHKPDRPDEMERVEAAGGRVINWNGYRVLGVLATSRSIGDYYLKPYVIPEPEVIVMDRTDDDEFLILASDGLWDVISNEIACDIVRRCFSGRIGRRRANANGHVEKMCTGAEAAAVLAELALARGSKDNISVVVIELKKLNNTP